MNRLTAIAAGALTLLCATSSLAAHAQLISETTPTPTATGTLPSDVKPGDWAYDAIQDCAAKGLIAGYPPDGDFLGGHAITRFEAATIVARLLAKVDALAGNVGSGTNLQQQIDEISKLTDDFKVELTVIGTNMDEAQADIKTLQDQVTTLQAGLGSAYDSIEEQANRITKLNTKINAVNDTSYGSTPNRKFNISGYIQFRSVSANGGSNKNFPNGSAAAAGAPNGFYAQGATKDGFQVRRARLKFNGQVTPNTTYCAQFDFSGAVAPASTGTSSVGGTTVVTSVGTATQQLTTREAWVGYTFGDGSKAYPTVTAGLFATPYGYILPINTSVMLTPERPLAFTEGSYGSPFQAEDYDKGIKVAGTLDGINLIAAVINGDGRNSENLDSTFSSIVSANYAIPNLPFTATVGASYFGGTAYATRPSSVASPASYPEPKKQLVDVNAQLGYDNFFVDGELEKGTFEEVSYFATPNSTSLTTNTYVKGNTIQGDYLWAGYNFDAGSAHQLTFAMDYDTYQRSISAKTAGFGSPAYDDVNVGYGALYNLDKATRLRLWYDEPTKITHAPGTGPFPALGLFTAELQVRF